MPAAASWISPVKKLYARVGGRVRRWVTRRPTVMAPDTLRLTRVPSKAAALSAREKALQTAERMSDLGAVREALAAASKESSEASHFLAIARIAGQKGHLGYQEAGLEQAWKLARTRQDFVDFAHVAEAAGWMGKAASGVSKALSFDTGKAPQEIVAEAIKLTSRFKDLSPVNAGLEVALKHARTQEEFLQIVQTAYSKGQHGFQDSAIRRAWALSKSPDELLRFAQIAEQTGWSGFAADAIRKALGS